MAFIKGSRTAPECGFSQRLIGILTETAVDFEVVNVLDNVREGGLCWKTAAVTPAPARDALIGGC